MRSDDVIEWRSRGVARWIGVDVMVGLCWMLWEVGVEEEKKKRGSPSTDDLRRRPKPARVRLAMPRSCQWDLGLSLGPLICLVGPEPIVAIRLRPKGL
ncbi:hypothetical protein Tco_0917537, partial [Tanacetum coccineum]